MKETFRVRVTNDFLVFSAAHFITYEGHVCERLHGHNYRVQAEISGPLDENSYVFDFVALRETLRRITLALDHHVLLPTLHPDILVTEDAREIMARFEGRRWVFPREDCVLLPVANTTAELLARYIGRRLLAELAQAKGVARVSAEGVGTTGAPSHDELDGAAHAAFALGIPSLSIGVDECEGQWGFWDFSP